MKKTTLLITATLVTAGCAHKPPAALDNPVRTLGVASNCGSVISRESLAWLNVGADDHTVIAVPTWALDTALPQQLEEATAGRVKVVQVDADLLAVMQWRGENMFNSRTEADMLRAAIRPPAQAVDAYLLYTMGADGTPSGQRVNVRYGVGIFSRINLKLAHVQCTAQLVDAATFKKVRHVKIGQIEEIGSDLNIDRWEDYSPEQMARVRTILSGLWRKGVNDIVAKTPL